MLLIVPKSETPHWEAPKPMVRGFGCRDTGDRIECEYLVVSGEMTPGRTRVALVPRGRPQREIVVEWPEQFARVGGYPSKENDGAILVLPVLKEEH